MRKLLLTLSLFFTFSSVTLAVGENTDTKCADINEAREKSSSDSSSSSDNEIKSGSSTGR